MTVRSWYPQLDVYDTIRRMMALVTHWGQGGIDRERLFISDFYYVNPSLLSRVQMTAEARKGYNKLRSAGCIKSFLKYPSPPLLYNKMTGTQNQALHNIVGRGLVNINQVGRGVYSVSEAGRSLCASIGDALVLSAERPIFDFIVAEFANVGIGPGELRKVTGLRRVGD